METKTIKALARREQEAFWAGDDAAIADGKIVERWDILDWLGMYQQFGLIPPG